MKPRDFLNFFKTRSGKIITFGALFAAGLVVFSVIRKHHTPDEDSMVLAPLGSNAVTKPQVVQSVVRSMQAFHPPSSAQPSNSTIINASPQPLPSVPLNQMPALAPISLFADSTAGVPAPKKLGAVVSVPSWISWASPAPNPTDAPSIPRPCAAAAMRWPREPQDRHRRDTTPAVSSPMVLAHPKASPSRRIRPTPRSTLAAPSHRAR